MAILGAMAAFFASSIGRYVLIAAVVGGLLLGIRQQGYNSAKRACEAAAQQREIEIMNKDIRIGELMAKEDERHSTELAKDQEKQNAFQKKLEDELAKRPVAQRCALTEPDRQRLQ